MRGNVGGYEFIIKELSGLVGSEPLMNRQIQTDDSNPAAHAYLVHSMALTLGCSLSSKYSGRQRVDSFMVIGSIGKGVRQEMEERAKPRTGINSRIFIGPRGCVITVSSSFLKTPAISVVEWAAEALGFKGQRLRRRKGFAFGLPRYGAGPTKAPAQSWRARRFCPSGLAAQITFASTMDSISSRIANFSTSITLDVKSNGI
jgi:hypothetical protein